MQRFREAVHRIEAGVNNQPCNTYLQVSAPLSNPKHLGNDTTIVTPIPQIVDQSEVGHFILLDDGYIKLKVLSRAKFELAGESVNGLQCEVMNSF